MLSLHSDISIVLGGAAGRGVQTIQSILTSVLKREGYFVSASQEYMSRIRGGSNSTEIRVTAERRLAYVKKIDLLLPLDSASLDHLAPRIGPETVILADTKTIKPGGRRVVDVPFSAVADELGNQLFANTVAAGVVFGILQADLAGLETYLAEVFARKGDDVVEKNRTAARKGYELGKHLAYVEHLDISLPRKKETAAEFLINGNDALGLGLLAGGANFLAAYPMSPSTGILTFFAERAQKLGLAVEQAEDEISAINMGLGASYAGARAIVTTSGGGFALMEEGVSLAGIIETPIVIHLAQRPGPATGLPTRTEQADLNLALYSGHGEFPRAIFSPGTLEELYLCGQLAMDVADKYQVPVFILTDQYLLDAIGSVPEEKFEDIRWRSHLIETAADYKRYAFTESGVSPRGVPGYGSGLVVVDSDEHTEDGHLTEDLATRVRMMDKRLGKETLMRKELLPPVAVGPEEAETILVGWGSTRGALEEALAASGRTDIRYLHFPQVWPLPARTKSLFKGAKKTIVAELNATGQFANLLKQHGVKVTDNMLQYTGEPFAADELTEKIKAL